MLKIYLAAPYQKKDLINQYAAELRAGGIIVTSSWLEEPEKPTIQLGEVNYEKNQEYAIRDVVDIAAADRFVLFTDPTKSIFRQGRTAELGIWIGLNHARHRFVPTYVVGEEHENIFHYMPNTVHFPNWSKFKAFLQAMD